MTDVGTGALASALKLNIEWDYHGVGRLDSVDTKYMIIQTTSGTVNL